MNRSQRIGSLGVAVFCLVIALALSSCSKKDVVQDEPLINPSPTTGPDTGAAAAAPEASSGESLGTAGAGDVGAPAIDMEVAYFDFDSYTLRRDARDALKKNADCSWKSVSNTHRSFTRAIILLKIESLMPVTAFSVKSFLTVD